MYKTTELLNLEHTIAKNYLLQHEYPWTAIPKINEIILELINNLNKEEYYKIKENVWAHKTAKIYDSAFIDSPTIIGANTEIRHCAFIRGNALIGEDCVIGNSCEIKNAIIFDGAQVPHYNYVGDSILGYKTHMGAGSITSNLRSDKNLIKIHSDQIIETGLKKMGAIIGDEAEIGCNAVLNPGCIIGRNAIVYPTSCVIGVVEENKIHTNIGKILPRK